MAQDDRNIMEHQQRLGIMPKQNMQSGQGANANQEPLISEILTKVNNAKDKTKKIAVLREHNTPALRMILKGAFDPNLKWDLPVGIPPFKANQAPLGTQHTWLADESKKLWHFLVGGNPGLSKTRKETMFIQVLENLSEEEANLLINIKDKKLNKKYKGLTANLVKDAFDWNDEFMRKNA